MQSTKSDEPIISEIPQEKNIKRKKDTTMKKMFAMLKEYYSIYREGRSWEANGKEENPG